MTYIIYHIPGVKVGCSVNFSRRKSDYPEDTVFEILEELDDSVGDKFAGDTEWLWADFYGYPREAHYSKSNWNVIINNTDHCGIGGIRCGELGKSGFQNFTSEQQSEFGSRGGNTRTGAGWTGVASRASAASPNHPTKNGRSGFQTKSTCPHCLNTGMTTNMKRWHFDNCKLK